jgi:hypothetical protein
MTAAASIRGPLRGAGSSANGPARALLASPPSSSYERSLIRRAGTWWELSGRVPRFWNRVPPVRSEKSTINLRGRRDSVLNSSGRPCLGLREQRYPAVSAGQGLGPTVVHGRSGRRIHLRRVSNRRFVAQAPVGNSPPWPPSSKPKRRAQGTSRLWRGRPAQFAGRGASSSRGGRRSGVHEDLGA